MVSWKYPLRTSSLSNFFPESSPEPSSTMYASKIIIAHWMWTARGNREKQFPESKQHPPTFTVAGIAVPVYPMASNLVFCFGELSSGLLDDGVSILWISLGCPYTPGMNIGRCVWLKVELFFSSLDSPPPAEDSLKSVSWHQKLCEIFLCGAGLSIHSFIYLFNAYFYI